jgi:hypothetical protein
MPYLMKAQRISAPTSFTSWISPEVDLDMSDHHDGAIVPGDWEEIRVVRQITEACPEPVVSDPAFFDTLSDAHDQLIGSVSTALDPNLGNTLPEYP